MNKPLYQFFTNDHHQIDELLNKATENPNEIQMEYYHQFRVGLLTHIKMEENILFPAAQKANGGLPLPLAASLRLDHGALTSLMVVPPTASLIKVIRHLLARHDQAEEKPGGMYDACETLTQHETQNILKQLSSVTKVPVHPPNPSPVALAAAKRALERAGYNYDQLVL